MTITLTIKGQTRKANRAPKGGVVVNGKFYRGGQFMPKQTEMDEIEQLVEQEFAEQQALYGAWRVNESHKTQIRNRIVRERAAEKEAERIEKTPLVRVTGNTYPHRNYLKNMGFSWDGSAWTGRKGYLEGRDIEGVRVQPIVELSGVELYDDMDRNENSIY